MISSKAAKVTIAGEFKLWDQRVTAKVKEVTDALDKVDGNLQAQGTRFEDYKRINDGHVDGKIRKAITAAEHR